MERTLELWEKRRSSARWESSGQSLTSFRYESQASLHNESITKDINLWDDIFFSVHIYVARM